MVNLNILKEEIESIGNAIRKAKVEKANKSVIDPLVKQLIEKKQEYADHNGGIGVDGKPFGVSANSSSSSASNKKPKDNNNTTQTAATSQVMNPENAAKKAAKKAEKASKKAAYKSGTATQETSLSSSSTTGGGAGVALAAPAAAAAATSSGVKPTVSPNLWNQTFRVLPLQLVINPNHHHYHHHHQQQQQQHYQNVWHSPFIALAVSVLTNTEMDLMITFDPKVSYTILGLENGTMIVGSLAMARYLSSRASNSNSTTTSTISPCNVLKKTSIEQEAMENSWMDYACGMSLLSNVQQRIKGMGMTLEYTLQTRTYLIGHSLTLADLAVFAALGWPCEYNVRMDINDQLRDYPAARRWVNMMASHPALQKATQLAMGDSMEVSFAPEDTLEPLVPGMNALEGACPGSVVTRFPPEPSGYLHIGHAKAVLLNDYYARRYKGRLIVRFDDTNPSKEKEEFQQSILEDLQLLDVHPHVVTYTSDYFRTIQGLALQLIDAGLAYMDDTPQEQMKEERANRVESKYRNTQSPEVAKQLFLNMCDGQPNTETWCLRAKIDMKSDNGTLRDPVLYRQNLTPHHRTGTTYKAYPTYDLACPIVDSIEGVTHALRTTEYNDRDEQYQWLLKAMGLRRVRIHAFSRVNFQYTVLSKRKLTWFVNQKLVSGWDDARMPTVRGVVRRGVQVPALKTYIYSQGASRRVVNMVWNSFWAENKKVLDTSAKRYMAIDSIHHVPLTVTNGPTPDSYTYLTTAYHPKDPSMGDRVIRISQNVILETMDVDGINVGESIVLMRWGVIRITKVDTTDNGQIKALEGEYVPDGDFKACKRKLTWMSNTRGTCKVLLTEFDHLVTKEKLEETDKFEDYVNPNTVATTTVIGDAGLKTLQQHDIIQLERRGFYRVDQPYVNEDKPLVLYMIPDGKSKSMSGLVGKLQHQ